MKQIPYSRYQIEIKKTPNILDHPNRFQVKVNRFALAKLLIKELIHYQGNLEVVKNSPCVYGVFSGPIGGFYPRQHLCVGCLRCTTEHPDVVQIYHNPERKKLGDSFFTPDLVDTIIHEAESGRIPIRGAGFRGPFGGEGWDSMWTDMSEIVRPTRDGIHGREFISTEVDIVSRPSFLEFKEGEPFGTIPKGFSIPIPLLFDSFSLEDENFCHILSSAAHSLQTLAFFPIEMINRYQWKGSHLIPIMNEVKELSWEPLAIEIDWQKGLFDQLQKKYPNTTVIVRTDYGSEHCLGLYQEGVRVFHFTADPYGRGKDGKFVLELIREVQSAFVKAKCREEVTFLGSGGIVAAEHLAKAILCGLDAVILDTPLLVALQAKFLERSFILPSHLPIPWGIQRLKNLVNAWRDQLLEILGAMGLREVRRLRGELGRAMFQNDLEKEAFEEIDGYKK